MPRSITARTAATLPRTGPLCSVTSSASTLISPAIAVTFAENTQKPSAHIRPTSDEPTDRCDKLDFLCFQTGTNWSFLRCSRRKMGGRVLRVSTIPGIKTMLFRMCSRSMCPISVAILVLSAPACVPPIIALRNTWPDIIILAWLSWRNPAIVSNIFG